MASNEGMNWGGAFAPLSFYKDREPDKDADDAGGRKGEHDDRRDFLKRFIVRRIVYKALTEMYEVVVEFDKSPGQEYTFEFHRDEMKDRTKETIAALILAYWAGSRV